MAREPLAAQFAATKARVSTEEAVRPAPTEPKFARLERKEVRLRDDQISDLAALVRQLMRARTVKSERITENTLIRVAVDLLLAHRDELRGATEPELRKSVTSPVRNSDSRRGSDSAASRVPDAAWPSHDVPSASHWGLR